MDLAAGISTSAIAATATGSGDAITISVMKKAMESQEAAAMQLIEGVAQASASLPDNLGQNINVTA